MLSGIKRSNGNIIHHHLLLLHNDYNHTTQNKYDPQLKCPSNLPRSPHGGAERLRARLRSAGSHRRAAAAGLTLQPRAEAGFEALQPLLDLGESPGAVSAAVQARRGDGGGHGLLDELVDPLARVLVRAGLREQSGDALEAGFVALSVTVCRVWKRKGILFRVLTGVWSPSRFYVLYHSCASLTDDAHLWREWKEGLGGTGRSFQECRLSPAWSNVRCLCQREAGSGSSGEWDCH